MVYPTFTIDTKAINMASKYGYSPYSDIVWSFDYALSGNDLTEAGFTVFLMNDTGLQGGNHSIDLGYSGLTAYDATIDTIKPGVSGGVVAVGFDTTGLFAVSATMTREISSTNIFEDAFVRDGVNEASVIPNSVSIRGGWPSYSYNTHNYNVALSSLDSSFKIVESEFKFKTIRARLGNVGKTIYVDYRNSPEEDFKPLVAKDINLDINSTTKYKAGISFAMPVTSNNAFNIGTVQIKNFHTEGAATSGSTTTYITPTTPTAIPINKVITALPPEIPTPPKIQTIVNDITDSNSIDNVYISTSVSYGRLSSVSKNNIFNEDPFNFGYSILLEVGFTVSVLTRKNIFNYESDDGLYKLYRNGICNYWTLSTSSLFITNSSFVPIGTYSPTIAAIYI